MMARKMEWSWSVLLGFEGQMLGGKLETFREALMKKCPPDAGPVRVHPRPKWSEGRGGSDVDTVVRNRVVGGRFVKDDMTRGRG